MPVRVVLASVRAETDGPCALSDGPKSTAPDVGPQRASFQEIAALHVYVLQPTDLLHVVEEKAPPSAG